MRLSKGFFLKITLIVTLVLLASLFATLDFGKIYEIFKAINLLWFFAALATLPMELGLKALRLKILISPHGKSTLWNNLVVTLVGLPFGTVTPGRIGDFAKTYTLSAKTSLSFAKSLAIGVLEKILDFISLSLFASAGIIALLLLHKVNFNLFYLAIFLSFTLLIPVIPLNKRLLDILLKMIYEKFLPKKQAEEFRRGLEEFSECISAAIKDKLPLAASWGIAILLWLTRLLRIYLLALSIGISAKFAYFVLLIPLIELIEIMPISIMGFGTREYAYLFLFSIAGVSNESAVALSLLTFIATAIPFSVTGYLAALKEHVSTKK